ncbi:MAG: ATP-binding protein [Candidatus Eremiobacterota bacterium]
MTQTVYLKPRARLVSILGEQLISDHVVGLIELVKNAYDADATRVTVRLEGLGSAATTGIVVHDNGFGMSHDDVVHRFLSPAVDHKARTKRARIRTALGRLPLGEKGVGRFAAQQLGRQLELVTRSSDAQEVVCHIDWSRFEDGDAYLSDIPVTVARRQPELFTQETGTRLSVRGVRSPWTRADVEKLQKGLRRLRSPNDDKVDFHVEFECPDFPELQNISSSDILSNSHYVFRAVYEAASDELEYEFECQHPALSREGKGGREERFSKRIQSELSGPREACGDFYLNLHVWDRTAKYLADSSTNTAELNALAGVSLFRDRMRVFPYGEPGNDWLHLDQERINAPAARISNNQVIGFVEIEQERNPDLVDKTNREGLIENRAFRELRALVKAGIQLFNSLWAQYRPRTRESEPLPEPSESPARAVKRATDLARGLEKSARPDTVVQITSDTSQKGTRISRTVTQPEAARELVEELDRARDAVDHVEDGVHRNQEILLGLAATGMAAERVVHEFGRQVQQALKALEGLKKGKDPESLSVLEACLGTLRNEFRVLSPYPLRAEPACEVDVEDTVHVAQTLNQDAMRDFGVRLDLSGTGFPVRMRPSSLIQVFDNLVYNALFWLQSVETDRRILIEVDASTRAVQVSDSGPGVVPEMRSTLFDEFQTSRPGGRGLGLYIVRELLKGAGSTIDLCDRGPLPGACFRIAFPRGDAR